MNLPKLIRKQLNITPGKRILVTSDVHGHRERLMNVLEKANFCDDDILVIVGDIVEKGPESLNTLRYIMKLWEKGNVIPLIGNVDAWRLHMINEISENTVQDFYDYLCISRTWYKTSFFDELTKELGYITACPGDVLQAKASVISHFQAELDFLAELPTLLETQNYVFVHGGLRAKNIEDNLGEDIFALLKYDKFMDTDICFDKYVVTGHWPVALYNSKVMQNNPIINDEKKIISIDGGCGIKSEGQLNLLIIPFIDCKISEIDYLYCDDFPVVTAENDQAESKNPCNIRWVDNQITIIERKDDFVYAEQVSTGRRLWIHRDYLLEGEFGCADCTDYQLPVNIGDKLSLVRETSRGYIVKKDGVVGWYCGKLKN